MNLRKCRAVAIPSQRGNRITAIVHAFVIAAIMHPYVALAIPSQRGIGMPAQANGWVADPTDPEQPQRGGTLDDDRSARRAITRSNVAREQTWHDPNTLAWRWPSRGCTVGRHHCYSMQRG